MASSIYDDPRFLATTVFLRRAKAMEYTDRADLQKVLVQLLIDPHVGTRRPDGGYEIPFGHYVLRYSLLDENDPHSKVSLDALDML